MTDIDDKAVLGPSSPFSSWKIGHAGIRVPDFDQAITWYTEKLGFQLLRGPGATPQPPYEALGDSYNLQGWHHIGIRVDDVDAAVEELRRRGVKIVSEPHDVEPMKLRVAFFGDPWGNLLELIAPMSS